MLKNSLILFVLFGQIALHAQEPVQRNIDPFTELEVGDKIIVRLVKAEKENATIQVQGISETAVKTENTNGRLKISIYGEPFTKKKVLITLSYKTLNAITVTGGAEVTTTSLFKAQKLSVDLKSGGLLYLDADIEELSGKIAEGSTLTAEGYATRITISAATAATLSAYDLECETANVKASSGGKIKINVETELNAEASSKGYISYKGSPAKITQNAISGGTISVYQP
jgi:hypothetical protein